MTTKQEQLAQQKGEGIIKLSLDAFDNYYYNNHALLGN